MRIKRERMAEKGRTLKIKMNDHRAGNKKTATWVGCFFVTSFYLISVTW
ncbi:MAG: hypothetical protein UW87_C0017G0003 [Candidatus Moranbacteria bacterium GW2011_GWC2_45_10]|nr:MAG: hypothetical protein UW87_C0017G0003 [Candidatus Moranbacteria bacterium GW2011_GWC2_45_10]